MENHSFKNNWETIKAKIKKEQPALTDEDLKYEIGKEEELLLRLQKKLGKNREEMDKWLSLLG